MKKVFVLLATVIMVAMATSMASGEIVLNEIQIKEIQIEETLIKEIQLTEEYLEEDSESNEKNNCPGWIQAIGDGFVWIGDRIVDGYNAVIGLFR